MREKALADEKAAEAAAAEQARIAAEADAESARRRQAQEGLQKTLETATDVVGQYESLLAMLQKETSSTSVYLGRKETTAEETVQIQYVAASENNKFMVGKTLAPPPEEEGTGEGAGISFDVWKAIEEEDAEGNPTSRMPDYKHVENVIREPNMSFFGIPKLGAYLAVPFTYDSYLHSGVFDPAPDAGGGEETPEGETPEEKVNTVPVEMICALDTMGQGRPFTDEEIACAQKWASLIGINLTRSEKDIYVVEKGARAAAAEVNAKSLEAVGPEKVEQQTKMQEEIEDKLKTEAEALPEGEELNESVKVLLACEIKTRYAKEAVMANKEVLEGIKEWSIGPKADIMKVLECVLYLLGYSQSQLYDMASRKADWSKLRLLFDSEFFNKIVVYNPISTPATESYAGIDSLKALLEGQDEAALGSSSVAYSAMYEWAKQAIESREEAIKKKEADNEANQ